MREVFDHLVDQVRRFGRFKVEAQKTRIVLQVRMSWLGGHGEVTCSS